MSSLPGRTGALSGARARYATFYRAALGALGRAGRRAPCAGLGGDSERAAVYLLRLLAFGGSTMQSLRTRLGKNLPIVVGIALPLAVVALFAAATFVPKWLEEPPAHDLLLTYVERTSARRDRVQTDLAVVDGRVRAQVFQVDDGRVGQAPRLFRFHAETGRVREIEVRLPENAAELADGTEIPIPELADVRVTTALTAPDGYVFRGRRGASGGLAGGLFGIGRGSDEVLIEKDGAIERIPLPVVSDYYLRQVDFLGWVVDERPGPERGDGR